MLRELRIENLLLIERAELRLGEGLNAITGETGAGKTVLAHSLDLLMGGKAKAQIVRPGAAEAWVEGVFDLPEGLIEEPEFAELAERLPADAEEVVLGRRGSAGGRPRALVAGRAAPPAPPKLLGGRLFGFFWTHQRLRRGSRRHRRRPEAAGRSAIGLLRPARAPAPDDLFRPARDPRRIRRGRAPEGAERVPRSASGGRTADG